MNIRQFRADDFESVLAITIEAFAPLHLSFQNILGEGIFNAIYPDWEGGYREYLSSLTETEKENFLVALENNVVVDYIIYSLDRAKKSGELGLNCVDPTHQSKGIGLCLYNETLSSMKNSGIKLVEVATGDDDSHAPARRAYEKAGFTALPLARYYKLL